MLREFLFVLCVLAIFTGGVLYLAHQHVIFFNPKIVPFSLKIVPINETPYYFSSQLTQTLKNNWMQNLENEYFACIQGSTQYRGNASSWHENQKIIQFESITSQVKGQIDYVQSISCKQFAVLHNHPVTTFDKKYVYRNSCVNILDDFDANSARVFFEKGGVFYLVQCDSNKFEIYSRENLFEGTVVSI